jgi:hypothetical protein
MKQFTSMPRVYAIKKSLGIVTLFLTLTMAFVGSVKADFDSKGTEFWIAFLQNLGTPNLQLFITSDVNTTGTVEIPGLAFSTPFTVITNTVTTVALPSSAALSGTGIQERGIHITAAEEVTVYALNQISATTDAFLALPVDILNIDYYVMTYANTIVHTSAAEQFGIVALFDNTNVDITVPGETTKTIVLNRGQAYQEQRTGSGLNVLTGTRIQSDKPVAVFGGNRCTNIPFNQSVFACDHVVEQIPPLASWGKTFFTVPLATRQNGDTFRILAGQDNTIVQINGTDVATLNAGQHHEQIINGRSVITASKPVLVAQYSNSSSFDNVTSDPFMLIIPPVEQALSQYTFSTPGSGFAQNFVNVVAPNNTVGNILLDGTPISADSFVPIGTTNFSGAQVSVGVGSHTITGPEPFSIYSYGFASFDSYGYPGGLALEFINPIGDSFIPNVVVVLSGTTFQGVATDNEDINTNAVLDPGEDLNNNGTIDPRTEDLNNNGVLDPGEDTNDDGILDIDTGIFAITLDAGAENLELIVPSFTPNASAVNFTVNVINPLLPAAGVVRVTDGAGNQKLISLSLGGNQPPVIDPIGNKGTRPDLLLEFEVRATDPDGDTVTLLIGRGGLPLGATFTQTPGNPAVGQFLWLPASNQAGQRFTVNFVATDNGSPPLSVVETVIIGVGDYPAPDTNTDPNNPDTDDDTFTDEEEITVASSPLNPLDVPFGP